jgi:hypothetical protein
MPSRFVSASATVTPAGKSGEVARVLRARRGCCSVAVVVERDTVPERNARTRRTTRRPATARPRRARRPQSVERRRDLHRRRVHRPTRCRSSSVPEERRQEVAAPAARCPRWFGDEDTRVAVRGHRERPRLRSPTATSAQRARARVDPRRPCRCRGSRPTRPRGSRGSGTTTADVWTCCARAGARERERGERQRARGPRRGRGERVEDERSHRSSAMARGSTRALQRVLGTGGEQPGVPRIGRTSVTPCVAMGGCDGASASVTRNGVRGDPENADMFRGASYPLLGRAWAPTWAADRLRRALGTVGAPHGTDGAAAVPTQPPFLGCSRRTAVRHGAAVPSLPAGDGPTQGDALERHNC